MEIAQWAVKGTPRIMERLEYQQELFPNTNTQVPKTNDDDNNNNSNM